MKTGCGLSIGAAVEVMSLSVFSCVLYMYLCASSGFVCIYSDIVLLSGLFHHHVMAVFHFIHSSDLKSILFGGKHLFLLSFNFQWHACPFAFIVALIRHISLHCRTMSLHFYLSFTSCHLFGKVILFILK